VVLLYFSIFNVLFQSIRLFLTNSFLIIYQPATFSLNRKNASQEKYREDVILQTEASTQYREAKAINGTSKEVATPPQAYKISLQSLMLPINPSLDSLTCQLTC
jgi:hypothetical protein